jgi:hypothetical protein
VNLIDRYSDERVKSNVIVYGDKIDYTSFNGKEVSTAYKRVGDNFFVIDQDLVVNIHKDLLLSVSNMPLTVNEAIEGIPVVKTKYAIRFVLAGNKSISLPIDLFEKLVEIKESCDFEH